MLSSKDFQVNEKRSMKKVQIEEDSSEGEDVDFGDANAKKENENTKDILTPLTQSAKDKDNKFTKQDNVNETKIEKMTEDEND